MPARIEVDHRRIAEVCRRHHIQRLSLFGSVLRDDFGGGSDVDVLVEFDPRHVPGFLEMDGIADELSPSLGGRRVDLVTKNAILDSLRDRILASSEVAYAEG